MTAAAGGATAGRVTFRGAAGGAILPAVFPVSFLLRKRATGPEGRENEPATPPGSHSREHFTSRCVACHLCVSRCPTNVLQPSVFEYGIAGLMQPVMDYSSGFCEYECNVCSQVCPTGAILPVTLEHKKLISIGTVQFIEDRCVVFTDGTACGACAEVCPTEAVHMIPYRGHVTQPETDIDICIGCGNCEYACPVEGGKAIYVEGKQVHELREERAPITEPAGGGRAARGAADEARARQTERGADDVRAPQPDRGAGPARDGAAADGGGGGAPGGPEPESLPGPGEEPWPF
jgi:ferredoxin